MKKKFFRFWVFHGLYHKWDRFRPFWLRLSGPGLQAQEGSVSLKFLVETRLKYESLIGHSAFLVKKLSYNQNLDTNIVLGNSYPNLGFQSKA